MMIKMCGGRIFKYIISKWILPAYFYAICVESGAVCRNTDVSNYKCESNSPWFSDKTGMEAYIKEFIE